MKKIFAMVLIILFSFCSAAKESVSYLFAGSTATYIKNVERTGASLKTVCPDYFEINADGSLKITGKADELFVRQMQTKSIRVTPYLSNNWDRTLGRAAVANRAAFVKALAAKVKALGCAGVNIDIQNLTEADRAGFTDFVRLLRAQLPKPAVISVCVAPNPWGINVGWQGMYDYAALAQYADKIFIMAYDEHYSGGPAGAVASYDFVEKSVKYALKYVAADKIVLGIPFYGRYWRAGASSGGHGITVSDAERLCAQYESKTWYDETAQCARATLTVKESDNAFIWGSTKLATGIYDIWYENDRSLEKKLSLVKKYNLGGAGSWALGQEPQRIWQSYTAWLEGLPFRDITNHWAQSYIIDLHSRGILHGTPDGAYKPDGSLTRAEAAVLLLQTTGLDDEKSASVFADTRGHWAQNAIGVAREYRILFGESDGRFYPDRAITRQEFAVLCDRILYCPDTVDFAESVFSDVSYAKNPWSNKSVVLLAQNGILSGYPDGSFKPQNTITRAEAARVIKTLLDFPGGLSIQPDIVRKIIPIEPR